MLNNSMQLAASLGPRFYLNIYKCKQISETGAQQVSAIFMCYAAIVQMACCSWSIEKLY